MITGKGRLDMICRHCGRIIDDDVRFCPFCGQKTESHLRIEDVYDKEEEIEKERDEYEEPKGKRLRKALISIVAAVVFVGIAAIAVMVFVKPLLGEEPWEQDEAVNTDEIKLEEVKTMYVTSEDGLVMRSEPGEDKESIHVLDYGQEVQVIKTENAWAQIKADELSGWCLAEYLTEDQAEIKQKEIKEVSDKDKGQLVEPSTRIKNGFHGIINTEDGLNLRCGPGQDYDILMVVPYETEVVEEGREGSWLFIKYDGQYGWVNSEYVSPMTTE